MSVSSLMPTGGVLAARAAHAPVRLLIDSSGIGGIERHVAVLAAGLRRRGIDAHVLLLAAHGDNPWLSQLDALDVPYSILQGGLKGLVALCRSEATPLLHTHGYKAGIVGRIAGLMTGTPIVSTYHAGESAPFPVSLYQQLDEWTGILSTRISVSDPIRRRLPFASTLIANFMDVPRSPPAGGMRSGIGFIGRLSAEKGPDMFCRVAAALPRLGPWHIWGDGPMRSELQAGYDGKVTFHGMVADVSAAWGEIGLLVISSHAEGLPMVAIEALSAGVPVAAARVGALPDVIEEGRNGWLFEPGDDAALMKIVTAWVARRGRLHREWQLSAWRSARSKFGLDRGVNETLGVYARALGI